MTRELVLDIGITEEQYETWVEMEMSEFFVAIHCRKWVTRVKIVESRELMPSDRCNHSSFFDREGLNEARNLRCPMADCNFVWCKACQREIVPDGPEHSCDGSSEMKHLVEQQGWKYCPSK